MEVTIKFGETPTLTEGLEQMVSKKLEDTLIIFEVDDEEEKEMLIDEILHEVAIDIVVI